MNIVFKFLLKNGKILNGNNNLNYNIMIYTKEQFKKLWDSNDEGGGITYDDIADCAKEWGLYSKPRIHSILEVHIAVLKAANCDYDYLLEKDND